jgi:hypothetical protein
MTQPSTTEPSETGFASLIAAPVAWAAHFLASYATVAIWCAKAAGPDRSFSGARLAIGVYTVAALSAVLWIAGCARRRHRSVVLVAEDRDSPEARHRFLTFATMLLAGLSAIAIVYAAMVTVFVGSCR